MVSTNDNDANKTNEMDERTQDISNTNENINDDMGGNSNEVVEESKKAIDHEEEPSDDESVTIEDINIMSQMNSSQMAIGEEAQGQQPTT